MTLVQELHLVADKESREAAEFGDEIKSAADAAEVPDAPLGIVLLPAD